jgi:hypothetical protein
MPHIYIHSQPLLQGSATMMFNTATVILNRKIAVVRPAQGRGPPTRVQSRCQTPMVHLLLLLRPHWSTDRRILFEVNFINVTPNGLPIISNSQSDIILYAVVRVKAR